MHVVPSLSYLTHMEHGIGPVAGDYLLLKGTRPFDLADGNDRREFATLLVGLSRYLASGEARVGSLKFLDAQEWSLRL